MINQDKPNVGVPQTDLLVGSGYKLLIGSGYNLIIGALNALAGMTNSSKIASYETWGAITTTWATETRTWLDCGSLFDNVAKPVTSITNEAKP